MRHPQWEARLIDVVVRHQGRAFAWGRTDCATLFADCVEAVTGRDPLAAHRPWEGQLTALIRLRKAGLASVRDLVRAEFQLTPTGMARRGDLGFTGDVSPLTCPAVIVGDEAVSWSTTGWLVFPRSALVETYAVG